MTLEHALIGALALSTALLMILVLVLTHRVLEARRRYIELINKPFSFWQARERNRANIEAVIATGRRFGVRDQQQHIYHEYRM